MNRPARFTVADLRRAGLAAEQLGPAWRVEIKPDGTIALIKGDKQDAASRLLQSAEDAEPVEPQKLRVF